MFGVIFSFRGKGVLIKKIKIQIEIFRSSGVLANVDQIGIEFHTGEVFLSGTLKTAKKLSELLEALKQLYNLGFRLISNTPNNCVGKSQDSGRQYYTFFDVVLFRP
jgi:hypothetical protein